jgi:Family of unknown function (DUF6677)
VSETRAGLTAAETARAIPACILAFLLPGLGHFFLGKRNKGLIFLVCLLALFLMGVSMQSRLQLYLGFEDPLALLFSIAQMAMGAPYFLARAIGYGSGDVAAMKAITYEYGNTFTAVAGLLNILVILDAFDTALGRKP